MFSCKNKQHKIKMSDFKKIEVRKVTFSKILIIISKDLEAVSTGEICNMLHRLKRQCRQHAKV